MRAYIKENVARGKDMHKTYSFHGVPIDIVHDFTNDINLDAIVKKLELLIPSHLLDNVEMVYVAFIKDFVRDGRIFNAMYQDGAIYLSPHQDNEADLLDDIVHEVAHSLEKQYEELLYDDKKIEKEFISKRNTLYRLIDSGEIPRRDWHNVNYSPQFDYYLYNDVGYDKLRTASANLFYSPYAITSLREYWANGFENYLLGDKQRLQDLSPVLYNKIKQLFEK